MDTTTDAPRSRHSAQPDPTLLWAPLAGLTDAAAQTAASTGTVAITRGFDRNSRQRAKALRELLHDRDVAAIEVTPAPGSERLLADTTIASLVNLVGEGSWQPYRLAAKVQAPVIVPGSADSQDTEINRDVIGMTGNSGTRDVALSHVAVRPEGSASSSVTITSDGEPLSVPGGWAAVTLREQQLEIQLGGPDFAEQTFTTRQVRIETMDGPHRLVRDELPIAEFEGAVTFTAEPQGLVVHPA